MTVHKRRLGLRIRVSTVPRLWRVPAPDDIFMNHAAPRADHLNLMFELIRWHGCFEVAKPLGNSTAGSETLLDCLGDSYAELGRQPE
jgi:hypothetical protein